MMPAARGVKRTASKSTTATSSSAPKNKKKRGAIALEVPSAPKKRGRVFACGQGDVGQLGLGEDVVETTKFKHVTALGNKIVDVQAGGMHTIALDSDGKVWTFGCNDEGALGRPTAGEAQEAAPGGVRLPARAAAVCAGDSHSAALLVGGDVYAWGSFRDSHGSMGLVVRGREGKACREPVRVDVGEPAAGIASGGDHLVILTTSGSVYTMGCGEQGQLGRLSQRSATRDARQGFSALLVPSKVTLKGGARAVWAGYHATFALHAGGQDRVFAWGLNNYGQLGITGEKRKTAIFSPTECDAFAAAGGGWRKISAGQHHSLALDNSGVVYAVGRCEYGRLGLGDREGDAESLEPIPKLANKRCVSIAASTSSSFAVADDGEVYAWGMGSEGQLGSGSREDLPAPAAVERAALAAAAGGQHTVLLVEDPSAPKEESPEPERETAEQEPEVAAPEPEQPKEKPKGRQTKRQKKQEQEDEVSSTSSAMPSEVGDENKPQKLNGDEKKETPMEVDETDSNAQEKIETPQKPISEQTTAVLTTHQPDVGDTVNDKPDITDTSSQDTTDTESKSQTSEKTRDSEKSDECGKSERGDDDDDKLNDVAMKDEVNGNPEMECVEQQQVEPKTVESISSPLTTTA
ncbi:regulator of chromosome condensation [Amyelois transitella]|uniref:regulator of chromosome condensation n=1 Tax=Amyelois transitella TaxID=680683 RepID=UPI00298F96DD|nr:regulator of chromosome condensation [Amyelois transitella]